MTYADLPAVNALLNGAAAISLSAGYGFIRRRDQPAHRFCMLAALCFSAAFLACYLVYHARVGSVPFKGQGWIRGVYLSILLTHTVLAAGMVPLIAITLFRVGRKDYPRHRKIARWTLPLWLYVSVTGIVIYLMLYRLGT